MINKKVQHGQYFTSINPFNLTGFKEWFSLVPKKNKILEPFAGSNNLLKMISEIYGEFEFGSFDIDPPLNNVLNTIKTIKQDTITTMPEGFDLIITNPPYLAKNSSTRKGLLWNSDNKYDDLYKFCLEKMLDKYDFVAAIVPESFIVSNLFHDRLYGVISLTQQMFSDTECPVCIAMFSDKQIKIKSRIKENDFKIWQMDKYLGTKKELNKKAEDGLYFKNKIKFIFNHKEGSIGLLGVDNTKEETIKFVKGEDISPEDIKVSSRAITRIKIEYHFNDKEIEEIIYKANEILFEYRKNTQDVFMTAFKGLRKDNKYRRRLDFATAEKILNKVVEDLILSKSNSNNFLNLFDINNQQLKFEFA